MNVLEKLIKSDDRLSKMIETMNCCGGERREKCISDDILSRMRETIDFYGWERR